jgi:hypothetical protein
MKCQIPLLTFCVYLGGCAGLPLDQQYTQRQLNAQLNTPPSPCSSRPLNGSAHADYALCAERAEQRQATLRVALAKRHEREIDTAQRV